MGIFREAPNCFPQGWCGSGAAARMVKSCEYCHVAAALVFCRTDNMFVCLSCDTSLHARHERVWVCEVCEQAAASVTCRADAAALCVVCDRDIHSANPLAERHERVPVIPFYHPVESVVKSTASTLLVSINGLDDAFTATRTTTTTTGITPACVGHHDQEDYNTDPWIPPNTITSKLPLNTEMKSLGFMFSDSENFLDFDYPVSVEAQAQAQYNSANDSVVPVQTTAIKPLPFHHHEKHFEIDFTQSHIKSYNTPSLSVSSSSLDVGIVPDGSSISEISHPFMKSMNNSSSIDLSSSANHQGEKLLGLDREARVLRYREKKKNRKFEKTIRYASRKAYAETRPRIKGRFAKRTEAGAGAGEFDDIDGIFSGADLVTSDSRYGVVPSF